MRFRFSIIIKLIAASVIVVLLICTFIISSCTIPSIGMENSLYKGERVLVNKWSYGFRIPFTTMRILGSTAKRGDFVLFNNPNPVKWTDPIWMRESYIGQIAGIPGDVLRIDANLNLQDEHVLSPQRIRLYNYPCEQDSLLKQMIDIQNVPDRGLSAYDNGFFMRLFTISEAKRIQSQADGKISLHLIDTVSVVHEFQLPQKGVAIRVYPWNAALLCNTLIRHENRNASLLNDTLCIDGKPTQAVMFRKNYYWVASNNPMNIIDSRLFGLVPDDHIIGKVGRIWYPTTKDRFFEKVK